MTAVELRNRADAGAPWALELVDAGVRLYERKRALADTIEAFIGRQGTAFAQGDPAAWSAMDLLDELCELSMRKERELCGVFYRELEAAATASPGETAGECAPATRGNEGESRQALEPAGPARGPRGAEGHLPTESGPGGALTPAEPIATLPPKGSGHDK
ncbi:hypothetical protein WME76_02135 [Sorangium sp. So ce119]|uniref:hypothetical protein n=1 Tax=Sorangium sp. So ce119 TaxID=3133279 RepID=UPI003F604D39